MCGIFSCLGDREFTMEGHDGSVESQNICLNWTKQLWSPNSSKCQPYADKTKRRSLSSLFIRGPFVFVGVVVMATMSNVHCTLYSLLLNHMFCYRRKKKKKKRTVWLAGCYPYTFTIKITWPWGSPRSSFTLCVCVCVFYVWL